MSNKNNKILAKGQEPGAGGFEIEKQHPEDPAKLSEHHFQLRKRFLHFIKARPLYCLWLVFDASTLKELQQIWSNWVQCALCVPYSAFSENSDRRYLLRFNANFRELMEALHEISVQQTKKKGKALFYIDPDTHYKYLGNTATAHQKIREFISGYPQKKAEVYLWSVLECALEEGEAFLIERKNLLFDFECLLCLVKAPFQLLKHNKQLLK
ncbi:MAG: hypothetical protein J7539_06540 [Niabella sp.]|nr:hypothetical protein [Niabella sp.]